MTRSHNTVVDEQYGAKARDYVESAVHAGGDDLDALEMIAERERPDRAADLGAGGGHVAYRLARRSGTVTAIDLSAAMLDAVREAGAQRGISNLETCVASVEALPFDDGCFDMLACRFSAHHWGDFESGIREARRVLAPGATAVFIDVISPGHALFDTHLQAIELLRDPSHVRNYSEAEWTSALARSGFRVRATQKRRLRMEWESWVDRMQTPETHREAMRSLQDRASAETRTYFAIEPDGSFTIDTLQIEATACRTRSF
ncbi:S-adenosyl-L-methionine (SAM)-dependent methyltransferase PhcB [Novosphingobium indicum]|uniref:S-adenosyl-L-methionine (SAM)-dependent methyltransferase PhcB n=1 Tax=Novosphingobium indicum TaxID=462949 RepID=A0ABQ2JYW2_9SPHN|nr:class I SAM-dependent methyltransferase [Novosphingobium indicum]GGN58935.1 S-adenosyl-L-methionine (SAM)-dependent methyltransferase PhcB [Novosphingobium indicum]